MKTNQIDYIPQSYRQAGGDAEELVECHFGFLKKTAKNHLIRCLDQPRSGLLPLLWQHLYRPAQDTYIPLADRKNTPARNHEISKEIVANNLAASEIENTGAFLFANALTIPCVVGNDPDGCPQYGPPSKVRTANTGIYVHTLEYDPNENIEEFLATQIGWTYGGKKLTDCPIGQAYQELCRYRDFRGIEVVWSGNKSCHIHMVFDVRHLAPTCFKMKRRHFGWENIPDLPNGTLRNGFVDAWGNLPGIMRTHTGVEIEPDGSLAYPYNYRRLPWGYRRAQENHPLGFKAGNYIPQFVIWSKFRNDGRGAAEWLHNPVRFLELTREPSKTRNHGQRRPTVKLTKEQQEGFIKNLSQVCHALWGDYPKPVTISDQSDGYAINFQNHEKDQNPSTVVVGEYDRLIINGRGLEAHRQDYLLPLSANELIEYFLDLGHLVITPSEARAQNFIEKRFHAAVARNPTPAKVRAILPSLAGTAARASGSCCILSGEGAGKSSSILSKIITEDEPDEGVIMVASKSYEQAEEQCNSFNDRYAGSIYRGIVVHSFSNMYKALTNKDDRLTLAETNAMGYASLQEAVYARAGAIVEELEAYKREIWEQLGSVETTIKGRTYSLRGRRPVFFVAHKTAQNWNIEGGTRMWLHPDYREYVTQKNQGRHDQNLHKEIYNAFALQWLIHDEVSIEDIIEKHPAHMVEWCQNLVARQPDWSRKPAQEKQRLFNVAQRDYPKEAISFEIFTAIIAAKFTDDDLYIADPTVEPFGDSKSDKSMYRRIARKQWYVKPKPWWREPNHRLTLLTTERCIFTGLEVLRERDIQNGKAAMSLFDLDAPRIFAHDKIQVERHFDKRARSKISVSDTKDIQRLADELSAKHSGCEIISNVARGKNITTHEKAKGSNRFGGPGSTTIAIYNMLNATQYEERLIENAFFGRNDMVRLSYVDLFNQTSGRTLGFRHHDGSRSISVMSRRLWKQIGISLLTAARYRLV